MVKDISEMYYQPRFKELELLDENETELYLSPDTEELYYWKRIKTLDLDTGEKIYTRHFTHTWDLSKVREYQEEGEPNLILEFNELRESILKKYLPGS